MDRITERDCNGVALIPIVPEKEGQKRDLGEHAKRLTEAISRLAAYEDTGLTPEEVELYKEAQEISESMEPGRLVELAQAERDGRLVVLACKVGDTVFCVVNGCLWPEAECPEGSSSCDTCRENKKTVIENKLDCIESVVIASEHWGETVFATLQEAEAAERREVEHR